VWIGASIGGSRFGFPKRAKLNGEAQPIARATLGPYEGSPHDLFKIVL